MVEHAVLEARVVTGVVGVVLLGDAERGANDEPGVVERRQPLQLLVRRELDLDDVAPARHRRAETVDDDVEGGAARVHEVVVYERVEFALRGLLRRVEVGARVQPVPHVAVGRILDDRLHVARRHDEQLDLLRGERHPERPARGRARTAGAPFSRPSASSPTARTNAGAPRILHTARREPLATTALPSKCTWFVRRLAFAREYPKSFWNTKMT